ncbi:MAG: TIGR00303 family protein [Candidatus Nitrosocaldaceae archaeon]
MIKLSYNPEKGNSFIKEFKDPLFLLVLSYTETAENDGITVAGADKSLLKYTPPADAEFIEYGYCKSIDAIPATPDGKPTPALLTRVALRIADIPMLVIDGGSKIKPSMPYLDISSTYAKNIVKEDALKIDDVKRIYENSILLGRKLGKISKYIVIGESIPAGTTTALALLMAMGIDARFKVSSSMPNNPHNLKLDIVEKAMKRSGIELGSLRDKPLDAVSHIGDAMMITVAGLSIGASNSKILLAGGTQMCAILALIKVLNHNTLDNIVIGTTKYIVDDKDSNIISLVKEIADVPIISIDLGLERSQHDGLRAYTRGFVKEGAGAGGACIASLLKSNYSNNKLLNNIDEEYLLTIKRQRS